MLKEVYDFDNFNFNNTMLDIFQMLMRLEDEVVTKVAAQILGRKATKEDVADFTIIRKADVPTRFAIAHKDKALGIVERHFHMNTITVRFEPFQPDTTVDLWEVL